MDRRAGTLLLLQFLLPPGGGFVHLCQLLGFVVERVHHFAHVLNGFQGCLVRFVHRRLFEYDQHSFALVEDPCGGGATNTTSERDEVSAVQVCEIGRLPWNFLSRIICDNFLSTSPCRDTHTHEGEASLKKTKQQ